MRAGPQWKRWTTACVALAACVVGRPVMADGMFPDELKVFLPTDNPQEIVLATNFGLVITEDQGATWHMVCESLVSQSVTLTLTVNSYDRGGDGTIYGGFFGGIGSTADLGCDWSQSTGLAQIAVADVFADRTTAGHVLAFGSGYQGQSGAYAAYASSDRGATFAPFYATSDGLTGVEVAQSDGEVYVAGYSRTTVDLADGGSEPSIVPFIAVAPAGSPPLLGAPVDGGPWVRHDHPELAGQELGIQVDANDPATVYLRIGIVTGDDSLGISRDRGQTIHTLLNVGTAMSALAVADDGTIFTGTQDGQLWASEPDGGFTQMPGPQLRCLGWRAGQLYACGDDLGDGYALGVSTNAGASFSPLLQFQKIDGLASCAPVQAGCQQAWANFAATFGITDIQDAGASSAPKAKGCGCSEGDAPGLLALLLVPLGLRRRR